MNKFAQAASLVALAVAASSAGAWYAPPFQPSCMTDEQRQAIAEQQKAMAAQYAKAAEQALTAQREMAQRMADQQAAYLTQVQTGHAPVASQMGPDPFQRGAFGPSFAGREIPAMPEPPTFPEMPAPRFEAPPMPEISAPSFPEMPAFETAAAPEYLNDRMKEMDAYRTQAKQELAARRAAHKEMSERWRAEHSSRGFGPRPAGFGPGVPSGMGAGSGCGPAAGPAQTQPQAAAPAPASTVAVAPVQQ